MIKYIGEETGAAVHVSGNLIITDTPNENAGVHNYAVSRTAGSVGLYVFGSGSRSIKGGLITGGTDGGVKLDGGTIDLVGGNISGNKGVNGGGIVSNGELTISGGNIEGNVAEIDGGGVYANGNLTLSNGEIKLNRAGESGGGIYAHEGLMTLNGGSITENTATVRGGGIYFFTANITLNRAVITDNHRMLDGKIIDSNFYLPEERTLTIGAELDGTRIGITLDEQRAFTEGYSVYNEVNGAAVNPNEYFVSDDSYYLVKIDGGEVVLREPPNLASVSWNGTTENKFKTVSAAFDYVNKLDTSEHRAEITLSNEEDEGNYILTSDETLVVNPNAKVSLNLNGYELRHTGNNSVLAVYGDLIIIDNYGEGDVRTHVISGNAIEGGAITGGKTSGIIVNGALTMDGGTVIGNSAASGAGINVTGGRFVLNDGKIIANTALQYGGGVYVNGGLAELNGGFVEGNTARDGGGAYLTNGGRLTINDGMVSQNNAINGGGVYIYDNGVLTVAGGVITDNTATVSGGGIGTRTNTTLNLTGGEIIANSAGTNGGGIYAVGSVNAGGDIKVNDNTAADKASNLYLDGVKINVISEFGEEAVLGVAKNGVTGVITEDYAEFNTVDETVVIPDTRFIPDDGYYIIILMDENEVAISDPPTVATVEFNGESKNCGSFTMAIEYALSYSTTSDNRATVTLFDNAVINETFVVDENSFIIFDFNGYLLSLEGEGAVIEVEGDLIINDGYNGTDRTHRVADKEITGGVITGGTDGAIKVGGMLVMDGVTVIGNTSDYGGGVRVMQNGTLTVNSGAITDNTARMNGGAISVDAGASLSLNGGEIRNNHAGVHGGVFVNGAINVSGAVKISDNTSGTEDERSNLYLAVGAIVNVTNALREDFSVGVSLAYGYSGAFTVGFGENNKEDGQPASPKKYFDSDSGNCVRLNNSGEATVTAHTWAMQDTDATCTEDGCGNFICSACGMTKTDFVAALGHQMTYIDAIEPTCTEDGAAGHYHCSRCEKNFEDNDGANELATIVVPALGHGDLAHYARLEPTCTEDGWVEHWDCVREGGCGKTFLDAACTVEAEEVVLLKLGHSYGEAEIKNPTCTEDGYEKKVCSVCGTEEIIVLPATGHSPVADAAVEPTCTEAGLTEGSHCEKCDEVFTQQEEIPALGHSYGPIIWIWTDDNNGSFTVSAKLTCERDGFVLQGTATVEYEAGEDAIVYTAKITLGGKEYTSTKTVEVVKAKKSLNWLIGVFVGVAVIAGGLLAFQIIRTKKKKKGGNSDEENPKKEKKGKKVKTDENA